MQIADRLIEKFNEMRNPCCVGLDPVVERLPPGLVCGPSFSDVADAIRRFNTGIIDAIHDIIPVVKPQMAFYEKFGSEGVAAFEHTVRYAQSKGMIVIEDAKRNDIGKTSKAYAEGHLGIVGTGSSSGPGYDVDLLTVNAYLGSDGIRPFVDVCDAHGKGIFVLVKTSNKSSGELQDRRVQVYQWEKAHLKEFMETTGDGTAPLYAILGLQMHNMGQEHLGEEGYSSIGAVVGATYPHEAEKLRNLMRNSFFLVPGYGAQGGTAEDVMPCFNEDGYGATINSSSGIDYAYEKDDMPDDFQEAARKGAEIMIDDICSAMEAKDRYPAAWRD